jgi:hypothetical protein
MMRVSRLAGDIAGLTAMPALAGARLPYTVTKTVTANSFEP